jgi:membrane-associated phospholipid phosphatase
MLFLSGSFWQTITQWDQSFFIKLNSDWTNNFFDAIMPYLRSSVYWMPLYLFIFTISIINFKWKGLWWVIFFICTIALTDMTGTYVFKHNIHRLRPCMDPNFFMHVRLLLKQCAGGYGFISNHAANHFGMAVFFALTYKQILGNWVWLALLWAAFIAYSQIYVGVHYPLDVICGCIVGIVFGFVTATVFNKRYGFAIFDNQPTG